MNLRKFSIVLGLASIFLAGFWASGAFGQGPEEPLAPVVIPDAYDIGSEDEGAPASATAVGVNYRRPPDAGKDDTFGTTVGANQVVSAPQSIFPAGLIGRSETAIAVDADAGTPGENIVIGWNDADGFIAPFLLDGLSGWAFSSNSGTSLVDGGGLPFTSIPTSPPTTIVPSGDPWLALLKDAVGNGTFLYANLAVRANVAGNGPGTNHSVEGLSVHRGMVSSGALSWATPALIPSPSAPGTFGLDKEAMAVNPRHGHTEVYVSSTNFDLAASPIGGIVVFGSSDGGATFGGPTLVQGQGADGVQGSMPAVGTNGDVFVVWERGRFNIPPAQAKIQFRRSTDQGATFGPTIDVAAISAAARKPPAGYNRSRHNDFPRIAVAHSGPWMGRIYVTYHDAGSNPDLPGTITLTGAGNPALPGVADADVFIKYSDNGGATWSAPILVNGAIGDVKAQFWPVVSVTDGGIVSVVYYEDVETDLDPANNLETNRGLDGVAGRTRRSNRSSIVDTYAAFSTDGGVSFGTRVRVTDFSSNWSRTVSNIIPNYGDYIDAVSRETGLNTVRVYATWADGRAQVDINADPAIVDMRPVPSAAYGFVDITKTEGSNKYTAGVPKNFVLGQNYPNPFNPMTKIDYALPEAARVELRVYNLLGQEVRTLVDYEQPAGPHQIVWDGTDASGNSVASGIYFYKLKTPSFLETKKMMFVK